LDYYAEAFVDSEPFRSIKKYPLNCVDFNKIDALQINDRICAMMAVHDSEEQAMTDELQERLTAIDTLTMVAVRQAFSWFPRRYAEHKTDGRQAGVGREVELSENTKIANLDLSLPVLAFLLDFQASVLRLLRLLIELGIANAAIFKTALECAGLVLKTDLDKVANVEKSSILLFFKYCRSKPVLSQAFQRLLGDSLDLLQTLLEVRRHYQVVAFLKLWAITERAGRVEVASWPEMLSEVLNVFSLSAQVPKDQKPLCLSTMNKTFAQIVENTFPENGGTRKGSSFSEDLSFEVDIVNEFLRVKRELRLIQYQRMPVDLILVENMFRDQPQYEFLNYQPTYFVKQDANFIQEKAFNEDFSRRVCSIIMSNLDQSHVLFEALSQLVIFQGSIQRKIYLQLNSSPNQRAELKKDDLDESVPLSEKDLNSQIEVPAPQENASDSGTVAPPSLSFQFLEKELFNLKKKRAVGDPRDPGARLQIDQALAEVLRILLALGDYLLESYNTKLQFTKTQNLMRNLGFSRLVIEVLGDRRNSQLVPACLRYLHYFTYLNTKNLALLTEHMDLLLGQVLQHPSEMSLVANLVNSLEDRQLRENQLRSIFNKVITIVATEGFVDYVHQERDTSTKDIRQIKAKAKSLDNLVIYLKILALSASDDTGKPRKETQQFLLGLLINSPELGRLYESQFFFSLRKLIQSRQQQPLTPLDLKFIQFYLAALSFIADLGRHHFETKEQARRIVELHILQEYLASKKQVFVLKSEILKLYHYVAFANQIFLEKEHTIDLAILKLLLRDIVCPDLAKSSKYMFALIRHGKLN
jgi:hypothetical protein